MSSVQCLIACPRCKGPMEEYFDHWPNTEGTNTTENYFFCIKCGFYRNSIDVETQHSEITQNSTTLIMYGYSVIDATTSPHSYKFAKSVLRNAIRDGANPKHLYAAVYDRKHHKVKVLHGTPRPDYYDGYVLENGDVCGTINITQSEETEQFLPF